MLFKNERFFAGLSVPRLLNAETSFTNGDNPSVATFQNSQHVHLTSGALFRLSQNTYMQPIALVRYVPGAPVQADLGCLFLLNKTLWVGSAYRWKDAVSAIFSYSITRSLKVGYAYDFTLTRLNNHLGSHELYLGFDLIKKRDGFYHPRFF
jgi:type IX secretion system PorP/SprF family membrane protein